MKLFVWDFHGVLEKGTEDAVLEISNVILAQSGYSQRFTEENSRPLYGKKWFEYFSALLPDEPLDRHMALQQSCIDYERSYPEIVQRFIQPNDHSHSILERISREHDQIVISNTQPASLSFFLETVQMTAYFPDGKAIGINSPHPEKVRSKQGTLQQYLRGKRFDRIITIGDSPDDVRLVSVAGGVSYLYAHPGQSFRDCSADYKINDLRTILQEI
jgi:phosphoglycolate phosphatase-like HAD superfamily hydrolase